MENIGTINWIETPLAVLDFLRELSLPRTYLYTWRTARHKHYSVTDWELWQNGDKSYKLDRSEHVTVNLARRFGLIRAANRDDIRAPLTAPGTYYRLSLAGYCAMTGGMLPMWSGRTPVRFIVRNSEEDFVAIHKTTEVKCFKERNGGLGRTLAYLTETGGGLFSLYARVYIKEKPQEQHLLDVDVVENGIPIKTHGWPFKMAEEKK